MNPTPSHSYKLSIAPMLGITNNHYRSFIRLLTKHTLLYTEMINSDTIIHCQKKILHYFPDQSPLVLQFGGNDPEALYTAALKANPFNYTEFNLNCGCPSPKVSSRQFGASLMKTPSIVSTACSYLNKVNFTSIKCRIGLDEYNEQFLTNFISTTSTHGNVSKYILHCRVAIMGIDTIKNRTVPPLQHDIAYDMQKKFPHLQFVLNGGITTLQEVKEHNEKGMNCMIGRVAFDNPWMLRHADSVVFNKCDSGLSRKDVLYKYSDYCYKYYEEYDGEINGNVVCDMVKPIVNVFVGEAYNKKYKDMLCNVSDDIRKHKENIRDHIYSVIEEYEKMNYDVVNSI